MENDFEILNVFCDLLPLRKRCDVKYFMPNVCNTEQGMKFSVKNLFNICGQIRTNCGFDHVHQRNY